MKTRNHGQWKSIAAWLTIIAGWAFSNHASAMGMEYPQLVPVACELPEIPSTARRDLDCAIVRAPLDYMDPAAGVVDLPVVLVRGDVPVVLIDPLGAVRRDLRICVNAAILALVPDSGDLLLEDDRLAARRECISAWESTFSPVNAHAEWTAKRDAELVREALGLHFDCKALSYDHLADMARRDQYPLLRARLRQQPGVVVVR